jgi:DNA polymerase III delta prime subunit
MMNKNREHTLFVEKYRPVSLENYIGNEHLKTKVSKYINTGDIPHLLLHGKAGTGKTTLAKLLVSNIDCDQMYINASDTNSVDTVRNQIKVFASSVGFKDLKVIILDECDFLTPMETFSRHCRFILTCNYVERIIDPIQSRCQSYQIIPPSKKEVAIHTSNILDTEGISFDNNDIVTMVNSGYPDIRRIINAVQRNIIDNNLVVDTESIVQNDYKLQVLEILQTQDKKLAFKNLRQLLADSQIRDYADLFRLLYDEIESYGKGHIAEVILSIAKYELSDAQVVDKEINAMAMLIEILNIIK